MVRNGRVWRISSRKLPQDRQSVEVLIDINAFDILKIFISVPDPLQGSFLMDSDT